MKVLIADDDPVLRTVLNAGLKALGHKVVACESGATAWTAWRQDAFQVLIPSFARSQLKEAFQVGFLVFVPFLIIDMVVANILLSMGMSMLSPVVISLPFKLLLFVLVNGWYLVVRGLVLSYA